MELEHIYERTGTKMVLIADPTVLQQLRYQSAIFDNIDQPFLVRNILAAWAMVETWECELVPDLKNIAAARTAKTPKDAIVLDEITNPKVAEVIMWAGNITAVYANTLDEIEKN